MTRFGNFGARLSAIGMALIVPFGILFAVTTAPNSPFFAPSLSIVFFSLGAIGAAVGLVGTVIICIVMAIDP
jgi:hypothetical protein